MRILFSSGTNRAQAISVANAFTTCNLAIGAYLIWNGAQSVQMALPLFLLAFLSDGLDGYFARRAKFASRWGAVYDSVADGITAGLMPAVFIFQSFGETTRNASPLPVLLSAVFFIAAVSREFRQRRGGGYFIGLPNMLVALSVIQYIAKSPTPAQWLILLPTLGMVIPVRFPTLRVIQAATGVPSPLLVLAGLLAVAIIPSLILLLNLWVAWYLLRVLFRVILCFAAKSLLEYLSRSSWITLSSDLYTMQRGIYTFFCKDIWLLLVLSRRLQRAPHDFLVIVGDRLGGRFLGCLLRSTGYRVRVVRRGQRFAWRQVLAELDAVDAILVSADGPLGPYGTIKRASWKLARRKSCPLFVLDFETTSALQLSGLRGGLRIPVPNTSLSVACSRLTT